MNLLNKYKTLKTDIAKRYFIEEILISCDNMFPHTHPKKWEALVKILMDDKEIHNPILKKYSEIDEFPIAGSLRWVYSVNVAPEKLEEAIKTKNKYLLDDIFYGLEEAYFPNYVETMNPLLLENWHHFHDTILLELQRLKDLKSIEPLYIYLKSNQNNPLLERAVWALADIGTSLAKEKLQSLLGFHETQVDKLIEKRLELWSHESWRKEMKPLSQGWYLTDEEDDSYTKELHKELAKGHPLYGQSLKVIVHQDRAHDDVLCKHLEKKDAYSMVHLTWSGSAECEGYPTYTLGLTWEMFLQETTKYSL